jgi:hypothetical protein
MMARKRTLNRADLRAQADAAEAKEKDDEAEEEEVEEEAADDDGGDDDEAPKPKKAAVKKAPAKKAPAKRTRVPKEVRMKAVWIVFDNSSKRVKEFPYPQKTEAEAFLAEKVEEKKGTFYLSLVKEPMGD